MSISMLPLAVLVFAAFSLVAAAPFQNTTVEPRQAPGQVIMSCTVPNTAALTFDDGPYNFEYDIVNMLDKAGAKGTFFVNGNNWGCIYAGDNPNKLKYAYSHGHQIASHTWSHKHLPTLTWDQLHEEFWRVEQALDRILGVKPAFMRPPYGEHSPLVLSVASARSQSVVVWDFDSGDSVGFTPPQSIAAYEKLAERHPSTVLTLNHETYAGSAHDVLPKAIEALKGKGYKLVTVAECLGQKPYQSVGTPQSGTWTC